MPSFPPKVFSVGTTAVLLSPYHEYRSQWSVKMRSTGQESGNTGTVWIGIGTVPQAAAGNTASQIALSAGTAISETKQFQNDQVSKDAIYAIASTASQIIEFYEVVPQQ